MNPDQQPNRGSLANQAEVDGEARREPKRPDAQTRIIAWVAIGFVLLGVVGVGGYLIGRSQNNTPSESSAGSLSSTSSESTVASTTRARSRTPVTGADFRIDVTVTEKKCYGSAGCNLTYTISPTFLGATKDLEGRSFKVIYEVTGGDDPEIGNFTLTGTNMRYTESSRISTPSADPVLSAQVTSVVENG